MDVAEKNRLRERRLLTFAAGFDQFTLSQMWEITGLPYGWLSRTLLKWWREDGLTTRLHGSGKFVEGHVFTMVTRRGFPNRATYRWIEPECENEEVD